jgi:hypothetical protein
MEILAWLLDDPHKVGMLKEEEMFTSHHIPEQGMSKMLDFCSKLMWLVTQEDFITFSCSETFKSYTHKSKYSFKYINT